MQTEYEYKEVDFNSYCSKCKHKDLNDTEDPCNECLTEYMNLHSRKPVHYEEK